MSCQEPIQKINFEQGYHFFEMNFDKYFREEMSNYVQFLLDKELYASFISHDTEVAPLTVGIYLESHEQGAVKHIDLMDCLEEDVGDFEEDGSYGKKLNMMADALQPLLDRIKAATEIHGKED